MTQKEIKENCDKAYADIQTAKNMLKEMRKICLHPNTFYGKYSYRIGALNDATICSDCGDVIKIIK